MPTTSRPGAFCDDPIRSADYRRLFAVLDDVLEAGDLREFHAALLGSLAHHFGWRRASIRQGSSTGIDPLGLPPVISQLSYGAVALSELRGGEEGLAAERFCRFHEIVDAVVVFIDAGRGSGEQLVVMFEDRKARRADRVLLGKLGRQLAPLLQRHLPEGGALAGRTALSPREQQVADLVVEGLSNGQIARRLHVTVDTVKKHLTHVFAKTGCSSRTQLALTWSAARSGLTVKTGIS
jgi:DNA-binding CsgD family transcriptional regulator